MDATYGPAFAGAFTELVGVEGGLSLDPRDPGNWTGGKVGSGRLLGTKYGIAANSYPTLDIPNLTLDQAAAIYFVAYWRKVRCDLMPAGLALLMFDAAVNTGPGAAVRFLQQALGTAADGAFGAGTAAALTKALGNGSPERVAALRVEFQARRTLYMASLSTWATYGLGWSRRLMSMLDRAATFKGA